MAKESGYFEKANGCFEKANGCLRRAEKNSAFAAKPTKKAELLTNMQSETDVNGSYTGTCLHKQDKPVQDVDDL